MRVKQKKFANNSARRKMRTCETKLETHTYIANEKMRKLLHQI